jgi:hypothetical protein
MPHSAGGYGNVTRSHHHHRRLRSEPTFSAREAAALLERSYSWLDQGLRDNKFTVPDGTKVEPRRTAGRYRRFTLAMVEAIALSCCRRRWLSMEKLKSTYCELLMAAYRQTGEYKIPC